LFGEQWKQRFDGKVVNILVGLYHRISYLFFIEGIVEGKGMILDVLRDTIDLVLWLVYFDLGIRARNRIYFSTLLLLFEDRPLAHTNRKLSDMSFTLRSALEMCGESIFSRNLFFSIINSKSISTFLPLWALMIFFSSFSLFAYYILSLLSSRFFYIFLISYRWALPFLSLTFISNFFKIFKV